MKEYGVLMKCENRLAFGTVTEVENIVGSRFVELYETTIYKNTVDIGELDLEYGEDMVSTLESEDRYTEFHSPMEGGVGQILSFWNLEHCGNVENSGRLSITDALDRLMSADAPYIMIEL